MWLARVLAAAGFHGSSRLRTHKQDSQSRYGVMYALQLQERGVERVLVE
jgi:hypothetical protein